MENESHINQVKRVIKSLVISKRDGTSMKKLCEDYIEMEGTNIPFARFGYRTLTQFLASPFFSDVIYLQGKPAPKVYARDSERSAHIQKLVQGQNLSKGEKNHRQRTQVVRPFERGPLEPFVRGPDPHQAHLMLLQNYIRNMQIQEQTMYFQEAFVPPQPIAAWNAAVGPALEGRARQVIESRRVEESSPVRKKSDSISEIVEAKPATRRQKLMQTLKKAENEARSTPNEKSDLMLEQIRGGTAALSLRDNMPKKRYPDPVIPPPCKNFHDYRLIKISEVNNPHKFWIQFRKQKTELITLMRQIQEIYQISSLDMIMESNEIRVNQLCAVRYEDLWHRASIVEAPAGDYVKILMVDYGTCERVPTTDIFKLHENFFEIPVQSVCCYLRNVKPKAELWTMQNVSDFIDYIDGCILFCKIYPFDSKAEKYPVDLVCANVDEDLDVATALME